MKKIIFLLSFFIPVVSYGQYIITDPDGYMNVREKPSVKANILGKVLDADILYVPDCINDIPEIEIEENWMAIQVKKGGAAKIGYVYSPNTEAIWDLPRLNVWVEDSLNFRFFDAEIKITIGVDKGNHKISSIGIEYYGKKYNAPKGMFEEVFLPPLKERYYDPYKLERVSVYKGKASLYYLVVSVGDGGEHKEYLWIIEKGKIRNKDIVDGCEMPCVELK